METGPHPTKSFSTGKKRCDSPPWIDRAIARTIAASLMTQLRGILPSDGLTGNGELRVGGWSDPAKGIRGSAVAIRKEKIESLPCVMENDGKLSGEENMRRDVAALESVKTPGAAPHARFYQWSQPTLSYGRLQSSATAEALARSLGILQAVRRPTGGGMVAHGEELSFSLAWRRDDERFPRCLPQVYRAIHTVLADALIKAGFDLRLLSPATKVSSPPGICFNEPVEGDVMWKGQKVIGGALKVTSWGRLYQGDLRTDILTTRNRPFPPLV